MKDGHNYIGISGFPKTAEAIRAKLFEEMFPEGEPTKQQPETPKWWLSKRLLAMKEQQVSKGGTNENNNDRTRDQRRTGRTLQA